MTALDELRQIAASPDKRWLRDLDRHASGVADTMREIHGGTWNVAINHRSCFVMVVQEIEGWNPEIPPRRRRRR